MDSVPPQSIDDVEILTEHVRVLVVFGGYVLFDGRGQRQLGSLAERHRQDAVAVAILHGGRKREDLFCRAGRVYSSTQELWE